MKTFSESIKSCTVSFNRIDQYDFIKGISIISVILHHALTAFNPDYVGPIQYTIGHAVPLFIIVTILLHYTKYDKNHDVGLNYSRIFKSIVLPFFWGQIFIVVCALILGFWPGLPMFLYSCGLGPGTYYVVIYFQIIFLSKYIFSLLSRNFLLGATIVLGIHIFLEVFFQTINLPQWMYRLLCTRYLFLFVISYLIFKRELWKKYKIYYAICALIGLLMQIGSLENGLCYKLYNNYGFPTHKFYRDFITLFIFMWLWNITDVPNSFRNMILWCGKNSYTLFIGQMIFFALLANI